MRSTDFVALGKHCLLERMRSVGGVPLRDMSGEREKENKEFAETEKPDAPLPLLPIPKSPHNKLGFTELMEEVSNDEPIHKCLGMKKKKATSYKVSL